MKQHKRERHVLLTDASLKFYIWLVTALLSSSIYANPVLDNVSSGNVTIQQTQTTTTVNQTSQQAIINWQSFNIGQQEATHFQQPVGGVALNRINPENGASQIYGSLTATGQVILVNPAGIYFGPSAVVNVGGMIATTGSISDSDFLRGYYHFSNDMSPFSGAIVNEGQLVAAQNGLIALIAPGVINRGIIQAELGKIVLASGNAFTMTFSGNNLVSFVVDEKIISAGKDKDGNKLSSGVENTGLISANGGSVLVTAKAAAGVLDKVINMQGVVEAKAVAQRNGEIILAGDHDNSVVRVKAKIDASGRGTGQSGGNVTITGYNILLDSSTLIDVSGDAGAGNIFIGGNYQGKGPLLNSNALVMMPQTTLLADAITSGNGGNVILWSDNVTKAYGNISVQGGSQGGNGGFVETSSHGYLDINGINVNTLASHGTSGTWLLDPYNITISSGDANYSITGTSTQSFDPNGSGSVIDVTTLQNGLANANIIVTTGSSGNEAGNITVANPISWNSAYSLSLNSAGSIILNADITNSGAGVLNLNGPVILGGNRTLTAGDVLFLNTINGGGYGLTISNTGSTSIVPGVISNLASLTKTGAGTLTLSNTANTYTGTTAINGGVLVIMGGDSNGYSSLGATPTSVTAASLTINNGTLKFGSGANTLSANRGITITNNAYFDANGYGTNVTGTNTLAGVITGTGKLVVIDTSPFSLTAGNYMGGGELTFTATNTYSGGTEIRQGTFAIGSNTALPAGTITINNSGYNGTGYIAGIRASGAARTVSNAINLNGDIVTGRVTNFSGNIALQKNAALFFDNPDPSAASTATFSGVISGPYSLTVSSGTRYGFQSTAYAYIFTGQNTYSGGTILSNTYSAPGSSDANTNISGGNLSLGANSTGSITSGPLGTGTFTINGGLFGATAGYTIANPIVVNGTGGALANNASTLTLSGAVTLNTGAIFNIYGTGSTTLSGVISGAGGLNIFNTGTLTLTNANTYTGPTNVSGGNLVLSGNGTATSTTFTVNQGGILKLDNSGTNNTNRISDTNALTLNGGELNVIGNAAANSTETIGALTLNSGYSKVTLTPNAAKNLTVTFASYVRNPDATVLFRGTNLGANTVASATANNANIVFTSAPTLIGGGGNSGTNTVSILDGAIGANTAAGTGTDFLTYNPTGGTVNGLRLLQASEYQILTDSTGTMTTNANVKITGTRTASDNATINSLIIDGGAAGITYTNSGTTNSLEVYSGNIMSYSSTGTAITNSLAFSTNQLNILTNNSASSSAKIFIPTASNNFNISGSGGLNSLYGINLNTGTSSILNINGNISSTNNTGLTINSGTAQFGASDLFTTHMPVVVRAGGTLALNGNNLSIDSLILEAGGSLGAAVTTGAGTLTVGQNGGNTITLSKNGGSNGVGYTGATMSGKLALGTNLTINVNDGFAANDLTISSVISGSSSISKSGSGRLSMSGVNTYTGGTNINNGILALGTSASAAGTGSLAITSGSTLLLTGVTLTNSISSIAGTGTVGQGAIQTSGAAGVTGAITLSGDTTVNAVSGSTLTLGSINGAYGLTTMGVGTVVFNSTIGNTTPLTSLTTSGVGATTINSASITTSGSQTYNNTVTLGNSSSTTLTATGASSDITLAGVTSSNPNVFSISAGRNIILNGAINNSAGSLNLTAGSLSNTITTTNLTAVDVDNFNLLRGSWQQISRALPAFKARSNFQINSAVVPNSNAEFIRALVGDGSVSSPYVLTDIYGLQAISSTASGVGNATLTKSYSLGSNIDALVTLNWNNGVGFNPIGDMSSALSNYFTGNLNGNNYTISNLNISYTPVASNTYYSVGLFSYLGSGSLIQNLHLSDAYISGGTNVGAIAGSAGAPTLQNVSVSGKIYSGTNAGGLIGNAAGAITFANSYNFANVTATNASGDVYAGGITGALVNGATISSSGNYGTITTANTSGTSYLGGIVGASAGSIQTSYNGGNITGTASYAGGITGFNNNGSILNSYSTGSITGNGIAGGIVGALTAGNVTTSYSSGTVSGTTTGGLIGSKTGGTVTNSYWDINTSGQASSPAGVGLTTAQSLIQSNYTGFTFGNTIGSANWYSVDGVTRPILQAEYSTTLLTAHQVQLMNLNTAASYVIAARSIDMSGTQSLADVWASNSSGSGSGFIPIGTAATPFSGSLNGQGNALSNLYIYKPNETTNGVGLFGNTSNGSTIQNLYLTSSNVTGRRDVGTLAGISAGTVNNVGIVNTNLVGTGEYHIGGLIGYAQTGSVSNSFATGGVTANSSIANFQFGLGGVIGLLGSAGGATLSSTFGGTTVTGTASGSGYGIGGLVGSTQNVATIQNSYATGNVYGPSALYSGTYGGVGGLLGYVDASSTNTTITNTYASGLVSSAQGASYVGGLVGNNAGTMTVNNSFWDTATTGLSNSAGSTGAAGYKGMTTAQMQTTANFTTTANGFVTTTNAWSFAGVSNTNNPGVGTWFAYTGSTRPMLMSEYSTNVYTPHQLQMMGSTLNANYTLRTNIDLSSVMNNAAEVWGTNQAIASGSGFVPIGTGSSFVGTFNGNGNQIANLYIYRPATTNIGLFNAVSGTLISNLALSGNITGSQYVGLLAGSYGGTNAFTNIRVEGNLSLNTYGGGLVGLQGSGGGPVYANNIYSLVNIYGNAYYGGLFGRTNSGSVKINNAYVGGNIGGGGYFFGGLIGLNYANITANNVIVAGYIQPSAASSPYAVVYGGSATVTNSFYDTGTTSRGGGSSTTTLMTQANYSTWDFNKTWGIIEGQSYPYLKYFYNSTPTVVSGTSNLGANKAVAMYGNGASVANGYSSSNSVYTRGDGSFYYLLSNGSLANNTPILVVANTGSSYANAFSKTGSNSSTVTGMTLTTNTLTLGSTGDNLQLSYLDLKNALGSLSGSNYLYSFSGNDLNLTSGTSLVGNGYQYSTIGNTSATNGSITFNGRFIASNNVNLTTNTSGNIAFNGYLGGTGANSITINSAGTATFAGGANTFGNLSVTSSGNTIISSDINNSGYAQTYNSAVTLGANVALSGNNITFNSSLNSVNSTARNLTITDAGITQFNGVIGSTALNNLTVNSNDIRMNGGSITTAGTQQYSGNVTLGTNTILTGAGTIAFNNGISGNKNISIFGSSGNTTFGITGNLAVNTLAISGSGLANTIDLNSSSTRNWLITSSNSGSVNGLTGVSSFNFTGVQNLVGAGTGANTFTLSGGTLSGSITGNATASNTLVADNVASTFVVTGTNSGTATGVSGGFSNIQNLTGGSANDSFSLSGGTLTGTINGGAGTNTLTGDNVASTYVLTGTNSGTATGISGDFSNIQNLNGGSANDNFSLSGGTLTGVINGGTGTNTLAGDNVVSSYVLTGINSGTATGVSGGFSNIQNLTGGSANDSFSLSGGTLSGTINGGSGTNTLTGDNVANTWNITGTNSGNVTGNSAGFTNIQNLNGGNNGNTFIFADNAMVTGTINGGSLSQSNTLNYTAYTTPVSVSFTAQNSGTVTNVSNTVITQFLNINNVASNQNLNNKMSLPAQQNSIVFTSPNSGSFNDSTSLSGFNTFVGVSAGRDTVSFSGVNAQYNPSSNAVTIGNTVLQFNNFSTSSFNGATAVTTAPTPVVSTVVEQSTLSTPTNSVAAVTTGGPILQWGKTTYKASSNIREMSDQQRSQYISTLINTKITFDPAIITIKNE